MATKKQTQNQATEQTTAQVSSKMRAYREHLKVITKGLVEMATAAGRTEFKRNDLLRECYNVVGQEMDTFEGWKAKGAEQGHTYYPVEFKFTREQVIINNK